MKRFIYLVYILSLFIFMNLDIVNASYQCEYDYDKTNDGTEVVIKFDDDGTVSDITQDIAWDIYRWYFFAAHDSGIDVNAEYTTGLGDNYQFPELNGSCPESLYICQYHKRSVSTGLAAFKGKMLVNVEDKIYLFKNEGQFKREARSDMRYLINGDWRHGSDIGDTYDFYRELGADEIGGGVSAFLTVLLKGLVDADWWYVEQRDCRVSPYTGTRPTYNLSCPQLGIYQSRFQSEINEYRNCGENAYCISQSIAKVNEQENYIRNYCSSIMTQYNFDGADEQGCLESCIDANTWIRKQKESVGIIKSGTGDCGFSGRLLVWIDNIMRWIKYILPVLVILFGIIDFIKAIAADKEDEMKKAQGRFVKRLIAAALVFLIPLIIEFVLNMLGFKYDSCSLF